MTATAVSSTFAALGLAEPLLRALAARDYTVPTPIQARTIPHLLQGRDLLGIAQTGTGKTAAFALPMLQQLDLSNRRPMPRMPRALVLAPTRELATQIADSCEAYGKHLDLDVTIVFGGVGQNPQVQALRKGVDILVATPGRLLDLIQQRHCDLSDVEILVLDEADRMLDMGFLPDVRRILATMPQPRQSLLFSATMPPDITALANKLLRDPLRVEVTPPAATADRIAQSVHFVTKERKRDLLVELLQDPSLVRTLVFTRTKHGADRVVKHLRQNDIHGHAIHGNKSQNARERALDDFRDGKAHVLVATDIAARGIDVKDITHVVNFDLPNIPESYVHRIGRTARAGRDGIAISFCDETEREYLRDIEKLIKQRIPVVGKAPMAAKAQSGKPAPQPVREQRSDPWQEAAAGQQAPEATEPARPKQRNRPEPRQAPGPYAPTPDHERQRRPQQDRHQRPHQHRPATPGYVDPEQRRHEPRQHEPQVHQQQQPGHQQQRQAPAPRPHHGPGHREPHHAPARRPAPQGGPRAPNQQNQRRDSHRAPQRRGQRG
jgi:ATP-dependent RNA helicase RhlE